MSSIQLTIKRDVDIVLACQKGRASASEIGFSPDEQTIIVITISELTSNLIKYTEGGQLFIEQIRHPITQRHGLMITARDNGPGIADIAQVLQDGYSTSNTLGLGLPSVRRLMDEFDLQSTVGQGTTVTAKKWLGHKHDNYTIY